MGQGERKLIVGTNHGGYANERNISGLPFRHTEVIRCANVFRYPNFAWFKLTGKAHPYWLNLHWDGGMGRYDVLHFFNGISLGRKPWLSTFETYLPRWGSYGRGNLRWGLRQLAKPACKHLIALSECTRQIQLDLLRQHPDLEEEIARKLLVVHPAQPPLVANFTEKGADPSWIDLVIAGADFFRKGGLETLRVVDRMIAQGAPFRLTIISTLNPHDYATHAGSAELAEAKALIAKHPHHIAHYHSLPYPEVLAKFRKAHIGLLPTWADTYGYTVLEAQAAACPVISTDIRALPEINNNHAGWVIPVRKDGLGNAVLGSEAERKAFSQALESGLEAVLGQILANPSEIQVKGEQALGRILADHAPQDKADMLEGLYRSAKNETASTGRH